MVSDVGVYRDGLGYMGACKVYVLLLMRARSLCDSALANALSVLGIYRWLRRRRMGDEAPTVRVRGRPIASLKKAVRCGLYPICHLSTLLSACDPLFYISWREQISKL